MTACRGSRALQALHTPGHTAESTTYLLDEAVAFTGDTLLLSGVGRIDAAMADLVRTRDLISTDSQSCLSSSPERPV